MLRPRGESRGQSPSPNANRSPSVADFDRDFGRGRSDCDQIGLNQPQMVRAGRKGSWKVNAIIHVVVLTAAAAGILRGTQVFFPLDGSATVRPELDPGRDPRHKSSARRFVFQAGQLPVNQNAPTRLEGRSVQQFEGSESRDTATEAQLVDGQGNTMVRNGNLIWNERSVAAGRRTLARRDRRASERPRSAGAEGLNFQDEEPETEAGRLSRPETKTGRPKRTATAGRRRRKCEGAAPVTWSSPVRARWQRVARRSRWTAESTVETRRSRAEPAVETRLSRAEPALKPRRSAASDRTKGRPQRGWGPASRLPFVRGGWASCRRQVIRVAAR